MGGQWDDAVKWERCRGHGHLNYVTDHRMGIIKARE